ncbi:MAG TPA: hypothetical protein VI078_16240 [bacterium]
MDELTRASVIEAVRVQYLLRWDGTHGLAHWERVRENGLWLAARTGARADVVELFAYFHDACRANEHTDPGHGARGGALARSVAGSAFGIDAAGLELLVAACRDHTVGQAHADPTIATCWDADRLDLGRIGTMPRAERLCTTTARDPEVIRLAWARSRGEPDRSLPLSPVPEQ